MVKSEGLGTEDEAKMLRMKTRYGNKLFKRGAGDNDDSREGVCVGPVQKRAQTDRELE